MANAVILLGTNTGQLLENIEQALSSIESFSKILRISSIYKTEPWGKTDQPYFLNAVIQIETELTPCELLNRLLSIENTMGRKRIAKWEPRIIDLDILFYGDKKIKEEGLTIPHPHLHERRFTLEPLAEILPSYIHPVLGKSVVELLSCVPDHSTVSIFNPLQRSQPEI